MDFLRTLIQAIKVRSSIIRHLFGFLWQNKMWWMIPMILVLVIFFSLMLFAQSTPLGPFIYALF